jgi:hypothetical protein
LPLIANVYRPCRSSWPWLWHGWIDIQINYKWWIKGGLTNPPLFILLWGSCRAPGKLQSDWQHNLIWLWRAK